MSTIGCTCASKMDTEHAETPQRLKRWDAQIEHHWQADYVKHASASRYFTEVKYDAQRKLLSERLSGRTKKVNPDVGYLEHWGEE